MAPWVPTVQMSRADVPWIAQADRCVYHQGALAYEVFWSRMLSMVLGSSMYSFTLTVSTFLAGIALGSVIYAKFLARVWRQTTVFIVLEFGIGIAAYLTPYTLLFAPRGVTTGLVAMLRNLPQ